MADMMNVRCILRAVSLRVWVVLVLGCLATFSAVKVEAGEVSSRVYRQMSLPSFSSECVLEEVVFSPALSRFSCGARCLQKATCSAYCVTGEKCRLLTLAVAPGGPVSPQGGSSEMCFVPVDPSGATGEDLARGRPVEAPGTWDGDYAPAETVVSGAICESTEYDCYCSDFQLTPVFKVDLGASKGVGRVVVRVSTTYPGNFDSVYIYVGDSGSEDDALFHTFSGSAVGGEVLSLRGAQTLEGRYVSLYMKETFSASLCLCLLQVYAF
ncbi:uncharacterized protein [Penaeus vannamei]|uniref:uncharacterized protein n=1 Tax=Penaeus vannamei TaxID=6689 RepID=UPI00387F7851